MICQDAIGETDRHPSHELLMGTSINLMSRVKKCRASSPTLVPVPSPKQLQHSTRMNQDLQPAQDMFMEVAMDVEEGNGTGAQDNSSNNHRGWGRFESQDCVPAYGALLTKGQAKSTTFCSLKWGRLRTKYNLVKPITNLSGIPWDDQPQGLQLHTKYNLVKPITNLSGISWDDELGLNILDERETVWKELITKNLVAKSFWKKGWTHFSAMHALLGGVPAKGTNVFCVPKVPKHAKAPKAPKLPPSINVPSNQPNTGAFAMNTSTTSPESSGGVKSWIGGVESPTSIHAPTTSSITTISSKRSARDAALSDDNTEDSTTVISRTKSAGNGSKGSNKAPRNTTANALSGLNNWLGEIIPIFKDFNSKLNISLAPPASPVIAPLQMASVENCSTMSTTAACLCSQPMLTIVLLSPS
ncbi:hypothetical protein SERLADRAFT_411269 [Serpula lacrymans var. lacrymans S7.9]|uniref:Myb/SANT-like domain-containing protein n=1 Tax=Serpula lacrymans var. lacrymans (strain S7.9) TaxID=578457 RepID=F8PAA3_SERL9|nr:uncharacterized protein SERLADRAFT_411269 [Serpula lacrymans var. lacrymans S7.9]EGO19743.1 hypothetical protein SERLADRAFT_411269 [Serpula lacrymans var. lacrymans S7.9]